MRLRPAAEQLALLRADAERGVARAQRHLANRYLRGRGVPQDAALARAWMGRAASQGLAAAQRSYGEFLEQGIGGAPDRGQARRWYARAAAQGDPFAQEHLRRFGRGDD